MPEQLTELPLADLLPPLNDREHRDDDVLDRMAASIAQHGYLEPIRVTPALELPGGRRGHRVIFGWSRVLSGRRAGKTHIPAVVSDREPTEADDLVEKLVENECRGDTNPLDRAKWDLRLMQLTGWSVTELARNTHQSKGQVSRDLSMLDRLVDELKARVYAGELCAKAGYQLSRLSADQQRAEWPKVQHLSADAVADHVNAVLNPAGTKRRAAKPVRGRTQHGLEYGFQPGCDVAAAKAAAAALLEALTRLERQGLPLSTLPHLGRAG